MAQISIEVEGSTMAQLRRLGKRAGKPAETLAAELLTERVENAELNQLRLEIRRLRHDLSLATQAVLVTANGVNEDEARKWVRENLRDS